MSNPNPYPYPKPNPNPNPNPNLTLTLTLTLTAAGGGAECREDGAVHRGVVSGQYWAQDGSTHWLREGFGRQYSGENPQT